MRKWLYTGLMALGLLGFAAGVWPQAPTSFKIFDEGVFVSTIRSINCIGADITCAENLSAHRVDVTIAAAGAAPSNAQYVTLALDGTLTAERVLTGTVNQIILVDGGANTTITLSTPQDIHTGATPTFASISLNADTNQIVLDADEGSGFTGTITLALLTAARSYTFPDVTGEVSLLGQLIDLISEVTGVLPIANGGTDLSTTPTNGQLLIGNGTDYTLATLTGTANQITVTNGVGSITLSLPQDIAVVSSPTFASLSLNAATNQILLDADGTFTGQITMATLTASRTWTFPNETGIVALNDSQALGHLQILDRVTADTTVVNTTTETTIYTFSVPADILSDDRKLRLQLLTEVTDNTGGSAQVLTVRLKFGATTLVTKTIGTSTGSTDVGYPIEAMVVNDGATNAQEGELKLQRDSTSASNLVTSIGRGSSAEDTTANVTLVITIEWDIADPDLSITMNYASLELI